MTAGTLLSITVSNFGPFADTVIFSMKADSSKKELLVENTFEVRDARYNKVSYIYGANGAGKSNFCKSILAIQGILSLAPIFASNNPQLIKLTPHKDLIGFENPFKFDVAYEKLPTKFCIEILIDKEVFAYTFTINNGIITGEWLTKKYKRTETILQRSAPENTSIILKSELKSFEPNINVVKENVLCLSMAAFLNNQLAETIVQTIQSITVVNMASMKGMMNFTEERCTREMVSKYLKILQVADPTLKDIRIELNEQNVQKQKIDFPDLENRELVIKSIKVDIMSTHDIYGVDGKIYHRELPFLEIESNGTIKLLGILPLVFETLNIGGTLIVDEIENGLHPIIVQQLVEIFKNKDTNPLNAQLICTSHSKSLIENGVRRDQVWVISKNERGISSLQRVSDLPGMRAYENNGSKYLEKAFGNIPLNLFGKVYDEKMKFSL